MKTILSILIVVGLIGTAWAEPQKKTFTSTTTQKHTGQKTAPPPPISNRDNVRGVIPRGVLGGNPLQLFNPKAPAKYGTAAESVAFDPNTGKWNGIKLFEIVF